mmetsp:Transcript_7568/g.15190  ORF Transcript_7568/g.15190 Transcript_7568/m.15190 type:complete len:125 (-) Transcript_7568:995-1369(-)
MTGACGCQDKCCILFWKSEITGSCRRPEFLLDSEFLEDDLGIVLPNPTILFENLDVGACILLLSGSLLDSSRRASFDGSQGVTLKKLEYVPVAIIFPSPDEQQSNLSKILSFSYNWASFGLIIS